jgi:peptidoglycan/LPS O-acetylase OafA/YrhL
MPAIFFEVGAIFPFNFPAWSLFFELVANALWFFLKPRLGKNGLMAMCAAGAVLLILWVLHSGSINAGADQKTLIGGFPRVIYSFFAGIVTYRFWRSTSLHISAPVWVVVVAILAIFTVPLPRLEFDLFATLVLFPGIVLVGAMNEPTRVFAPACAQLGTLSYAIYVLHWPIYLLVFYVVERRHLFGLLHLVHPSLLSTPVTLVGIVALAWVLDRSYDIPVRRWLGR